MQIDLLNVYLIVSGPINVIEWWHTFHSFLSHMKLDYAWLQLKQISSKAVASISICVLKIFPGGQWPLRGGGEKKVDIEIMLIRSWKFSI